MFRALPEHPSNEQIVLALGDMARHYATLAHKLAHIIPQIQEENERRDEEIHVVGRQSRTNAQRLEEHAQRLDEHSRRLHVVELQGLPPMRPESKSSNDLARHLGRDVAEMFEAEQRNATTPPPGSGVVEAMVEARAKVLITKLRADEAEAKIRARDEADKREATAKDRERDARLKLVLAAGLAFISSAAFALEHFSRLAH
jgi:hypothetical protein